MIWNQLPYELQQKIIDRIVTLLETEDDDHMQDGLIAAIHELEVWSNSPCEIIGDHGFPEKDPFK
jgi:hypothetical protein